MCEVAAGHPSAWPIEVLQEAAVSRSRCGGQRPVEHRQVASPASTPTGTGEHGDGVGEPAVAAAEPHPGTTLHDR